MDIGKSICQTLYIYPKLKTPEIANVQCQQSEKLNKAVIQKHPGKCSISYNEIVKTTREELKAHKEILFSIKTLINAKNIGNQTELDDGSDSNPSEDNMDEEELKQIIKPIKEDSIEGQKNLENSVISRQCPLLAKDASARNEKQHYSEQTTASKPKEREPKKRKDAYMIAAKQVRSNQKKSQFSKNNTNANTTEKAQYIDIVDSWTQTISAFNPKYFITNIMVM